MSDHFSSWSRKESSFKAVKCVKLLHFNHVAFKGNICLLFFSPPFFFFFLNLRSLLLSDSLPPSYTNSNPSFWAAFLLSFFFLNLLSFSFCFFIFSSGAHLSHPSLLQSTWTTQDPSGQLSISLFLTFAVPPSLHPSLLLSLHPSISPSICLSGLFSPDDCSCVFFSKQKKKKRKRLFPPEGR